MKYGHRQNNYNSIFINPKKIFMIVGIAILTTVVLLIFSTLFFEMNNADEIPVVQPPASGDLSPSKDSLSFQRQDESPLTRQLE